MLAIMLEIIALFAIAVQCLLASALHIREKAAIIWRGCGGAVQPILVVNPLADYREDHLICLPSARFRLRIATVGAQCPV